MNDLQQLLNFYQRRVRNLHAAQCDTAGQNLSSADVLKGVATGRWDAALRSEEEFQSVLSQEEMPIKITDPVATTGTVFLINKDYADLQQKVNTAIATLRENGTLSQLSMKWFNIDVFAIDEALNNN